MRWDEYPEFAAGGNKVARMFPLKKIKLKIFHHDWKYKVLSNERHCHIIPPPRDTSSVKPNHSVSMEVPIMQDNIYINTLCIRKTD